MDREHQIWMKGEVLGEGNVLVLASQLKLFGGVNSEAEEGDLVDILYLDFKNAVAKVCFKGSYRSQATTGRK